MKKLRRHQTFRKSAISSGHPRSSAPADHWPWQCKAPIASTSCILDSCTISASYEVSEVQKALSLLPRTEKGSSTSSEEHYANLPDPTHYDDLHEHRDPLRDAEDRQSTPERNLSCPWAPVLFLSFHLDPFSHHVSLCSISNFPFATWQCHCWLLDCVEVICENVARAACFFFRPTPLGFRQVVQHVRLHVAEMSELVNWRKDGRLLMRGRKSKLVVDRHIVQCRHNSVTRQKPKNKTKPKNKNTQAKQTKTHNTKQTEKGKSGRQTSYDLGNE